MDRPEESGGQRLKVEKGLERQAVMLGLRLPYLVIYGICFLFSLAFLMKGVGFGSVTLSVLSCSLLYMVVKYADERDFIERASSQRLPKILINDLYKRLKSGPDQP